MRRHSRASRFSRRHCQCKCFQGVGNHERRGSDFLVQSKWFPKRPGREPHFSQSPGTHFVRSQREQRTLESVCVVLKLHRRRQIGMTPRLLGPQGSTPVPAVHDPQNPHADSWSSLDQVDLGDVFSQRIPTLKSCPHFLGRFRFSFSFAYQRSWGRVGRNMRVEAVWIDPDDVVASPQRFRVCWKRRVCLPEDIG